MASKRKNIPTKDLLPSLWRLMRAFRPDIRPQRRLIGMAFAALTFSVLARLLEPWPIKFILDGVIVPAATGGDAEGLPALQGQGPMVQLAALAAALVGITALRAFLAYFSTVGMALAASRTVNKIRSRLFDHIQRLSLAIHYNVLSGDLINRFTYDDELLREDAVTAALPLVVNLLTILGMLAVMFVFQWQLALIALAVLPLSHVATLRASGHIHRVVREQRERDGAVAAAAAEAIGSIKLVQALSLNGLLSRSFAQQSKRSLKQGARAQRLAARLERKVEILLALATALVLWRGAYLVMEGALTVGMLLVFVMYLNQIFRPVRQMAKYLAKVSRATASGERVLELLETAPEIQDRPDAVEARHIQGAVEFRDVSFDYGGGPPVLSGVSFKVAAGERVAVVGPSGGGKSTLLSLLLRFYDPSQGSVLVDGHDLRDLKVESLRKQMSVVLQESVMFAVSVRDNIAYGALDSTPEAIEEAARQANADGFIRELPQGYDSVLGERGATLSGGQRQRLAVARAMVRHAPILLLDEPTSGLDNVNRAEVSAALERCMTGKTAILVTHDLLTAQALERIIVIDRGVILASGTHDELMRSCAYYRELYREQLAADRVGDGSPPGAASLALADA